VDFVGIRGEEDSASGMDCRDTVATIGLESLRRYFWDRAHVTAEILFPSEVCASFRIGFLDRVADGTIKFTMLLTITTTHNSATDLGHLLRKNPARLQTFDLSFGKAHVFYPEATVDRCTAALMLEVDPIGLVRNGREPAGEGRSLEQYVNDRPYVASSFLSVAIADVFGSALAGKSRERAELVDAPIPLMAKIAVLPCRGGEEFLRRLFEPLGYEVSVTGVIRSTRSSRNGARARISR
jgi:hypothetical protein